MEITKKEIDKLSRDDRLEYFIKFLLINQANQSTLIQVGFIGLFILIVGLVFPLLAGLFFIFLVIKVLNDKKNLNLLYEKLSEEFFSIETKNKTGKNKKE